MGQWEWEWAYAGCIIICVLPVGGRNLEARPGGAKAYPVGFQEREGPANSSSVETST